MYTKTANEIFVIDDDVSIGDSISSLLRHKGYIVRTFNCGKEAVKKAKERMPDLALLDYLLPGEEASEIIDGFHNISGENLPIILMSASHHAAQKAKTLPVTEFIAKPFQLDLLLETVERNLN